MVADLGIVILSYNVRDLLKRCLETVFASEGEITYNVVVVDNNSPDDSVQMLREHFPPDRYPNLQVIVSDKNGGYSYGNNLGFKALGYYGKGNISSDAPRYALLLNPDTEVEPTSLRDIVAYMDANPDVGIAGPKLVLPDGSLDLACRRSFPTPEVAFYHYSGLAKIFPKSPRFARYNMTFVDVDQEIEVDSVVGAYMQLRRECIEAVGLLDEVFFMYGEDLDWALRVKTAGWKVMYHPQVTVKHVKRASSRRSPKAQFEFYRAMLIFYRKHFRKTTPLLVHLLVMMGLLIKGGKQLLPEMRRPSTLANIT